MSDEIIILISANSEWRAVKGLFPNASFELSPFGEWFIAELHGSRLTHHAHFFHGGWGKIAAAASTQYVIDRWQPKLIINLGTCGGFEGVIEREAIILAEKTLVYDIIEQMGDFDAHIAHYTTHLDLSWLKEPAPIEVMRTLLISGDRDLIVSEIPGLREKFGAVAGDWESGAIAWVAKRNNIRCLILRGVTDLVGASGGEAYAGNIHIFHDNAAKIMRRLVESLPEWLAIANVS